MALTWVEDPKGVRRFEDSTLQGAVERALSSLDSQKRIAAVVHGEIVNGQGQADVSLVYRPDADSPWTVCAAGYKKFGGDWGGGVQVVWSK